jgi:tetratricopeptide (TPR) repeat protein
MAVKKQKRSQPLCCGLVWILSLAVVLVVNLSVPNAYAQKDKDKNQDEAADPAEARKKYEFELKKNWSFGYENYKNKQYKRASRYFWKVVELDTINMFNSKPFRYLGNSYFQLQNPDSAQIVFELGSNRYPDDVYLHQNVGFLLVQRGDIAGAIPHYEKTVELEPESSDDLKQLAALYTKEEKTEEAIATYEKYQKLNPDDLEVQSIVSELYRQMGDMGAFVDKKIELAQQDPQNSQVRFELGEIQFRDGEYEKAIEWFEEFLKLTPDDVGALEYIASSYQRLEQYNKAATTLKGILKINPNSKKTMCEISDCYRELKQYVTARNYANQAIAKDRRYGQAWLALGRVYEAGAEQCSDAKGGEIKFDEKLVYELAYQKYLLARRDMAFQGDADRQISFVKPVLPTREDTFMNPNQTKPKDPCYSWIPESEFGDAFKKAMNGRIAK